MVFSTIGVSAMTTPVDCTSAKFGKNCSYIAFHYGSAAWRVTYFYTASSVYITQRPAHIVFDMKCYDISSK